MTLIGVRVTAVAVEKQEYYIFSKCVLVALIIQQAKRMGRIILSSMTSLTLPHYSTLLNKR